MKLVKALNLFQYLILLASIACQGTSIKSSKEKTKVDYLQQGKEFLGKSDFLNAKKVLKNCLSLPKSNFECNWEIGWAYYGLNEWENTIYSWKNAKKLSKNKFKPYESYLKEVKLINKFVNEKKPVLHNSSGEQNKSGILLAFTGDTVIGKEEYKNSPFLKIGNSILKDSFLIGNLEGPICDLEGEDKCSEKEDKCYSFKTPKSNGKFLKDIFNGFSLSNNHSLDYGLRCYKETKSFLNENKIAVSGAFGEVLSINQKNKSISVLSLNTNRNFKHNIFDLKIIKRKIQKLKKEGQIVIVSIHAGAEGNLALEIPYKEESYKGERRGDISKVARSLIKAGADIIFGHGPHVIRGAELYKNKLILYSLGNFFTRGKFNLLGLQKYGAIINIKLDLSTGDFLRGSLISTEQTKDGIFVDPKNTAFLIFSNLTQYNIKNSNLIFHKDFTFSPKLLK